MSTSIRYLRLYMHQPAALGGGRRAIGYLSQYGDILRISFESEYIADPNRPTLSLSYRGGNEPDTQSILASSRDARLVRTDLSRADLREASLARATLDRCRLNGAQLDGADLSDARLETCRAAGIVLL